MITTKDPQKIELSMLMEPIAGPCISLYAPMEKASQSEQNPIRVQNLLRQAAAILSEREHSQDEIRQWLKPVESMLADRPYWENQKLGFAAFLSPQQSWLLELDLKVPEQVRVGQHFHLKPLLPMFGEAHRFYLLSLSQNCVRLFDCSPGHCQKLTLPQGLPESMQDFDLFQGNTGTDYRQGRTQAFSGASGATHGVGLKNDELEEPRLQFLRQINQGLTGFLGSQNVPLVLAGVDDLVHALRKELDYSGVFPDHLSGNFDHTNPDELHSKALPLAQKHFQQLEQQAVDGYHAALATQKASSDLDQVLPAAMDGRIETLFVARGQNVWGQVSQQGRKLDRLPSDHPQASDLLDLTAMETLRNGGRVFALEMAAMPDVASPISAVFRY